MKKFLIIAATAVVLIGVSVAFALVPKSESSPTTTTRSETVVPAPDPRVADVSLITGQARLGTGGRYLHLDVHNGDTTPLKDITIAITDGAATTLYRETFKEPLQPQSVGGLVISVLAPTGDWTWRVVSATRYVWYLDDADDEEVDMSYLDREPLDRRP